MKSLLLVAHGSRRKQSNEEVKLMAQKLSRSCGEQYPIIHAGFLEIAAPLIPQGIEKCIEEGATSVIVLPYFLNSGRHVVEDIPAIVREVQAGHPEITIEIASHLGASPLMIDLLIATANAVV